MTGRQIQVDIDELVLHGFDRRDRHAIADAVRSELAASLVDWQPSEGRTDAYLDAGSFALPAGSLPAGVGRGVATQIRQAMD